MLRFSLFYIFLFFGCSQVFSNKAFDNDPSFKLSSTQLGYEQEGLNFVLANFDFDKGVYKEAKSTYKRGLFLFERGKLSESKPLLEVAYSYNPDNLLLNYLLSRICMSSSRFKLSGELYIRKGLDISPYNAEFTFLLGKLYKSQYLFDSAISVFNRCYDLDLYGIVDLDILSKEIAESEFAKYQLTIKRDSIYIYNLGIGINSIYSEFLPFMNGVHNIIHFVSDRPHIIDNVETQLMRSENIYRGDRVTAVDSILIVDKITIADSIWVLSGFGDLVNTVYNEYLLDYNEDRNTMLIYRNVENSIRKQPFFDILGVEDTDWMKSKENEFKEMLEDFHITSISFTSNERELYFVSDNADLGNSDIWYTFYDTITGHWEPPYRLPSTINTHGTEKDVFVEADGSGIYFSSDGHKTMGGLDIMYSKKLSNNKWSEPVNLGHPINTVENEKNYRKTKDGRAYYVSDRIGGRGGFDIYEIMEAED